MRHVEDELRDLFAAIEDQIGPLAEPRPTQPHRRQPSTVAVAAAVLVAVLAVGALVLGGSGDAAVDTDTAEDGFVVEGTSFDRLADGICERLGRARSGVAPRFATAEAYLVSVRDQRAAIEQAVDGLESIPAAVTEHRLVEATVAGLEESLVLLDDIVVAARAGDLDHASTLWSGVDARVSRAFDGLRQRGIDRCRGV